MKECKQALTYVEVEALAKLILDEVDDSRDRSRPELIDVPVDLLEIVF